MVRALPLSEGPAAVCRIKARALGCGRAVEVRGVGSGWGQGAVGGVGPSLGPWHSVGHHWGR